MTETEAARLIVERGYRALALEVHPDHGGTNGDMAAVNAAKVSLLALLDLAVSPEVKAVVASPAPAPSKGNGPVKVNRPVNGPGLCVKGLHQKVRAKAGHWYCRECWLAENRPISTSGRTCPHCGEGMLPSRFKAGSYYCPDKDCRDAHSRSQGREYVGRAEGCPCTPGGVYACGCGSDAPCCMCD